MCRIPAMPNLKRGEGKAAGSSLLALIRNSKGGGSYLGVGPVHLRTPFYASRKADESKRTGVSGMSARAYDKNCKERVKIAKLFADKTLNKGHRYNLVRNWRVTGGALP